MFVSQPERRRGLNAAEMRHRFRIDLGAVLMRFAEHATLTNSVFLNAFFRIVLSQMRFISRMQ
jgi:hypothetical protein